MKTIVITGKPFGKQRHRTTRRGTTYTPKETQDYEKLVRDTYWLTYGDDKVDKDKPIRINIGAYYPIPKATPKKYIKSMEDGEVFPTKKPDFDNISKIIGDALNGVAWHDDCQIVEAYICKAYAPQDSGGYVVVDIEEVN